MLQITAISGAFILLVLAAPRVSSGATVNVGAASWFAWWTPSFRDAVTGANRVEASSIQGPIQFTMNPSFLLGPALSVSFANRWTLSTVFLYGDWYAVHSRSIRRSSSFSVSFADMNIRKWDLDALVNCALLDYLKVFVGIKWQGYRYRIGNTNINSGISGNRMKLLNNGVGPGLGVALTLTLGGDLYLLLNASALYLYTTLDYGSPDYHREAYSAFGCNSTLSVAWHLASAGTTVSLGFRYQYLDYRLWAGHSSDFQLGNSDLKPAVVRDILTEDHFYGILISAVYSFSL